MKIIALLLLVLVLAAPASAGTKWFWNAGKAAERVAESPRVQIVYNCRGYGDGILIEKVKYWDHWLCQVKFKQGRGAADLLVTGKNTYKVWFARAG